MHKLIILLSFFLTMSLRAATPKIVKEGYCNPELFVTIFKALENPYKNDKGRQFLYDAGQSIRIEITENSFGGLGKAIDSNGKAVGATEIWKRGIIFTPNGQKSFEAMFLQFDDNNKKKRKRVIVCQQRVLKID